MRLLLVIPSLSAPNGLTRNVLWLSEALVKSGHAAGFAATSDVAGPVPVVAPGIEVHKLRRGNSGRFVQPLAKLAREWRPDAIVAFGHVPNLNAIRARRLLRRAIPLVVTATELISRYLAPRPQRLKTVQAQIRRWYPQADAVAGLSSGVIEDLAETAGLSVAQLRIMPNAVDCALVRERAAEEPDHPWFGSSSPPIVLAVGRLIPQKRYGVLIRAFARVREQADARLVILGDGPLRRPLEKLVGSLRLDDSVRLPGHISNPFACMARAAVFAHTAQWESFGSVLVEALACGTQVVATDCPGGPGVILGRGRYGRLVPPDDDAALAQALIDTLTTTGTAAAADRDSMRCRAEDFAAPVIAAQWLSLLRGLGASDTRP